MYTLWRISSYNRLEVHIHFYSLYLNLSPSSVSPTCKHTKLRAMLLPVKLSLGFTAVTHAQSLKCHCADDDHQGTVLTSSLASLLTLWVVCVCFPSCSGILLWLDVDTFLSFSVTLIIFEGSVMAEVYLVFYLVVLKMLSLVDGSCTFIHFVVLFDWLQKHNNITAFLFLVLLLKNRNKLFYTYSHTHYLIFIEQIMY